MRILNIGQCSQANDTKELRSMMKAFHKNVKAIRNVPQREGPETARNRIKKAMTQREKIVKHCQNNKITPKHQKKAGLKQFHKDSKILDANATQRQPAATKQPTQKFKQEQ